MMGSTAPPSPAPDHPPDSPSGDGLPPSLTAALEQLQQGDFQTRWFAMKTLVQWGEQAIDPLMALVEEGLPPDTPTPGKAAPPSSLFAPRDPYTQRDWGIEEAEEADSWEIPWFVAQILAQIPHPRALQGLVQLIHQSPQQEIAQVATTALAQLGDMALPALGVLVECPETRLQGMQALAQMNHPGAVPWLRSGASDPDPHIRALAIEALTGFLDPQIPAILAQALKDPAPQVRLAALAGVGGRAQALDPDGLVVQLSPLVWDLNLSVACQAAIALGRMAIPSGAAVLIPLLDAKVAIPLQIEAIRSLGRIGSEVAVCALGSYLQSCWVLVDDRSQTIAREILTVLGQMENPLSQERASRCLVNFLQTNFLQADGSEGKGLPMRTLGIHGARNQVENAIKTESSLQGAGVGLDGESSDRESLDGDSLDGESLTKASLNRESLEGESLTEESLNQESLTGESLGKVSVTQDSLDGVSLTQASVTHQPLAEPKTIPEEIILGVPDSGYIPPPNHYYSLKQLAATSLGYLGQESAIEPLLQLLADPHPGVRFHAVAALKRIDRQQSWQRIQEQAQTPHLDQALEAGLAFAMAEWHH